MNPQTTQRKQLIDYIGKIEAITSDGERWREIQKLMFKINPALVHEDQLHCVAVAEKRLEQRAATGSSKSGAMRALYSMPDYLYRALQLMDPNFQKQQESRDKESVKRLNYKIWSTFDEYRLCDKI
jgi:hypothetical protein